MTEVFCFTTNKQLKNRFMRHLKINDNSIKQKIFADLKYMTRNAECSPRPKYVIIKPQLFNRSTTIR